MENDLSYASNPYTPMIISNEPSALANANSTTHEDIIPEKTEEDDHTQTRTIENQQINQDLQNLPPSFDV